MEGELPPEALTDDGEFAEAPSGPQSIHTKFMVSGEKGAWNKDLNNPEPDTTYVVDDRFKFVTDELGRCIYAEGELTSGDSVGDRNAYQQRRAGRREFDAATERHVTAEPPARQSGDQGGHIFATRFGGPGEAINLLPMDGKLNGPNKENWWAMENDIAKFLDENPDQVASLVVEPRYDGSSVRPGRLIATVRLGDRPATRLEFTNGS